MAGWITRREDEAQRNWTLALQTYHTALATYRHVLDARARREMQGRPVVAPPPPFIVSPSIETRAARPQLEGLTRRECEVAHLISQGYSNQQIAETLVLTRGTVANHVAHILTKLGATNRTQIAARMYES